MKSDNNKDRGRGIKTWLAAGRLKIYAIAVIAVTVTVSAAYLVKSCKDNSLTAHVDDRIGITPTQLTEMKQIGEWEFLSIEDEEMIDTVRKGLFKDDELMRIYSGTLRLGIDLNEASEDWISVSGDTLTVTLPKVRLLDEDFIDEAQTQSFFESGTWSDKARDEMYHRAKEKMKQRCLTEENLKSASDNACRQFYRMFKAMGFKTVIVRFGR